MNVFAEKPINPNLLTYLKAIRYLDYKPIIIGSYSLQSQKNAGDIDIDVRITGNYDHKQIQNEINRILDNVDKNDNMYFIELKIQYKNGSKKKFYANDLDHIKIPEKNYKNIEFIKIDFIIYLDDEYKEMSVNYWFHPDVEFKVIIKEIEDSIKEEKSEGHYFKAVKRYFSLAKLKNDQPKGLLLSKYLNNYYGEEYKILSNLKAIISILQNYDDPFIRKKIRTNLINIGIIPKISIINKLIKKIQKKVDSHAKIFLNTFEQRYI